MLCEYYERNKYGLLWKVEKAVPLSCVTEINYLMCFLECMNSLE